MPHRVAVWLSSGPATGVAGAGKAEQACGQIGNAGAGTGRAPPRQRLGGANAKRQKSGKGQSPLPWPRQASVRSSSGNQRLPTNRPSAIPTASAFLSLNTSPTASPCPASDSAWPISALGTRPR